MRIKLVFCLLILVAATSACDKVWRGWVGDYDKPTIEPRGPWEQTQDAQTAVAHNPTAEAQTATSRAATDTAMLTAQAATDSAMLTALAATETMAYMLEHFELIYHQDFTDGRDCHTGDRTGAPANPTINMTEISVRFDPPPNTINFELVFGQVCQLDAVITGEVGFYNRGGDLLDDHIYYNHTLGNNMAHFQTNPEGSTAITRWELVNNEWVQVPLTRVTGSWDGNVISLNVPWPEIAPGGDTTSTQTIFWYATTANQGYTECDAFLLDVNDSPHVILPDGPGDQ